MNFFFDDLDGKLIVCFVDVFENDFEDLNVVELENNDGFVISEDGKIIFDWGKKVK